MNKKIVLSFFTLFIVCAAIFSGQTNEINAKISEQNACTTITNNVVYYNANLFNYNYNGFNAAARNMNINSYNALSAEQKLALDRTLALTGPAGSSVRALQYTGIGLVRNTLDANGNAVNTNTNRNGVTFFPTQSEVTRLNNLGFGTVYDNAYFNVKFPFQKLSNGYTRFYSSENHMKYIPSQNKLELHQGTAGGQSTGSGNVGQTVGMWPFNADCWPEGSSTYGDNVLHYGLKITIPFYMTSDGKTVNFDTKQREDMKFNFSGDDDVWVFVDNKLALDIGGEHGEQLGWINFATNQSYTQITDSTTSNVFGTSRLAQGYHTLTIFYMERPGGSSNFKAEFNLPDIIEYSGNKVWDDNGNAIGVRPDSYTLKLYRNGVYQTSKTFTTNAWKFSELPKYDDQGNEYAYTVQEDVINLSNGDRYEPTISGTTVKNTLVRVLRTIFVKHIDKATNKVLDTDIYQGYVNTNQDTSSKNITGYTCVTTPSQNTLTYKIENQTVNYYYLKESNVIAKYIDENTGSEITSDVVVKYKEGDSYTTEEKTFNGYKLTSKTSNTSGTVGRENITVIYRYKKISAGVDVKYIDEITGEEISLPRLHLNGLEKDSYTTTAKDIVGYELETIPENANGEMKVELTTVTYGYRKNSNVISRYIDENSGEEIIPNIVVKYKEGYPYSTSQRTFDGYRLVSKTDNTYGTVEREDITVTYYYKKISAGVDVRYIDEMTGENIAGMIHMSGLERDPYTTSSKAISGYELVTIPENATGEMTVPKIDVTYGYKLISYVTVRCVDENTNRILYLSEPVKYLQGDTYRTVKRDIEGYTYTRVDKAEEAQIGREDITVTYYYKKNTSVTVKYVDMLDNNKEIHEELPILGLQGDEYTTKPVEIPGYAYISSQGVVEGKMGSSPSTVIYKYKKLANLVTEHIDANTGLKITEDVTTTYKEGDAYEALAQNIQGYVVVQEPEEKTGIMGREEIRKQYYYKKISKGLVVKYVDVKTNEVLDRVIYEGNENDKVTLETKQFLHYVLDSKPDMDEVLLTPEAKELIYYYRRTVEMDVVGIDVDTGEELYQTQISGREDDNYSTIAKPLDEYQIVGKDKAEGIFERSNTRIEFLYKKISEEKYSTILLKYVDKDTKQILKFETITSKVGDKYSTEKLDFENYNFVEVIGNVNGIITDELQEVTYYYTKKTGKVIVVYKDEDGNIIKEEEITGKVEENYKVDIKEIDGYKIVERPSNTEGKYIDGTIKLEVKLQKIKEPVKTGKVIVIYEDENGKEIKREEATGKVGENYKVNIEEIDGYELVGKPEKTEGKYIDGTIEIKVILKKIAVSPVTKGTIIVKYLDEEGNVIKEETIREGAPGDDFYIELPEIDGYKVIGDKTIKAKFVDGRLVFNAIYEKIEEPKEDIVPDTGDVNIISLSVIMLLSVMIIMTYTIKSRKNI